LEDLIINRLFFIELGFIALFIAIIWSRLHYIKLYKKIQNKYFNIASNKDIPIFYSSSLIKQEANAKFFKLYAKKETVLKRALVKNINLHTKLLERTIKKHPSNYRLLLLYAKVCLLNGNQTNFDHILETIQIPFYAPQYCKASYYYLRAQYNLHQTDMMSASKDCSKALKLFKKLHFTYEEAECYLALSQTYRISGIYDVAYTMLKEAKKIFSILKIDAKIAEATAYMGLIELGRENYTPAKEYLDEALQICQNANKPKTLNDIKNWQGLVMFLEKDYKNSKKYYSEIEKSPEASLQSKGFAEEMLARISLKNNQLKNALTYVNKAIKSYQQTNHNVGIFENLYLKAEILYQKEDYQQSKDILSALIKQKTPHSTTYYPANAYTLLGLINLAENNINLATTLFKQALDLEHSQDRLKGAIVDYNNLAEIYKLKGDKNEENKYLNLALKYAKDIDDKELITYLEKKLS
jgi:hypothetical protein